MKKIHKKYLKKPTRLKKCECSRSEDGEDEEQPVKEVSIEEEKLPEKDILEGLAVDGNENSLTRTPCHDSGIDIRDSLPSVPIIPTKKVRKNYFT